MTVQHIKLPCWVLAAGLAAGCTDDGMLTEHERAVLETMVFDDQTPLQASRTNKYADDVRAAELGHAMYFDNRYLNNPATTQNCRSCHDLVLGGADTKATGPTTVNTTTMLPGSRNTPTVFNVALLAGINHWSGNFHAVWSVPSDVGSSTLRQAHFMAADPYYRAQYEAVFGTTFPDVTNLPLTGNWRAPEWATMSADDQLAMHRFSSNLGKALEAYQRRLLDRNSAFDRFMNGDETAMSASAVRGAKLFVGKAACNECHSGPAFSDFNFHNLGVPQGLGVPKADYGRAAAALFQSTYPYNASGQFSDDMEYGAALGVNMTVIPTAELPIACNKDNPMPGCGAFKTARLRSVALTAPYMHTGGVTSLWDVVQFYNEAAGTDNFVGKRDVAIQPLFLSDSEIDDLVAFLSSLTGAPVPDEWARCPKTIPGTACSAP